MYLRLVHVIASVEGVDRQSVFDPPAINQRAESPVSDIGTDVPVETDDDV